MIAWLLSEATRDLDFETLITAVAERVVAGGMPLIRISASVRTMHPEVFVRNITWSADQPLEVKVREHTIKTSAIFLASPVASVLTEGATVRVDLTAKDIPYPTCREIAADGGTDYIAYPVTFTGGLRTFISFATNRPGGFLPGDLDRLRALMPALGLRLELASSNFATASLLRTYLGSNAADRVLDGSFRRGGGQAIEAAILLCDLLGFTRMCDTVPVTEVLSSLDAYFDCVAKPIERHGGEILKFIGDAILAVFTDCEPALCAAEAAVQDLRRLAEARAAQGLTPLKVGFGLHFGAVMYGNIGASSRLDFTVIGPAVNEAARVESMTKALGHDILLTEIFAARVDRPLASLGRHELRGVATPNELFTVRPTVQT